MLCMDFLIKVKEQKRKDEMRMKQYRSKERITISKQIVGDDSFTSEDFEHIKMNHPDEERSYDVQEEELDCGFDRPDLKFQKSLL